MYAGRHALWLLVACLPLAACADHKAIAAGNAAVATQAPQRGRLMPPESLRCERNDLTSYAGLATRYSRTKQEIRVTIETDAGTRETVTAPVTGTNLLNGVAFAETDWHTIESSPGVLRSGIRVIAWVCLDGKTPPVLDWRPDL